MSVRIPMKYGSAEVVDLAMLALQDGVVMEQKLDGTRCLTVITPERVTFLGHGGKALSHAAAAQHFTALRASLSRLMGPGDGELVLDGEIMCDDGTYWLFDVPYARFGGGIEFARPTDALSERRRVLETVGAELVKAGICNVRVVRQAVSLRERQQLAAEVLEAGGEGVMVKHAASPYEPGKRATHSLKVKYVRTADVVVTARDVNGAKNAHVAVYDEDGALRPMGAVTMIGKPDAQVGDVIEVAYLYVGTGGRLYQPRMMRMRPDREATSCRLDQFKSYSKAVL